ncbi:HEAT repeat domain-containing protein [Larkinella soli]|uniref:HEAT repeat domain-containing protein n=1 Tax=Larkinella soli TaxID=1770527 RepID=UPI000FFBE21D|nr:HEAT repeat domain-containing protein [Larkinella soli]
MKKPYFPFTFSRKSGWLAVLAVPLAGAVVFNDDPLAGRIKKLAPEEAVRMAKAVEATFKPVLDEGLSLSLWGVDSLVADPIAINMDHLGRLYYTRTNRQKNSEFDIRGHQDWEIESQRLQTIEEKRAFLRRVLSPQNSKKNEWLKDLNGDGSHDWRDMTVEKEQVFRLEDSNNDGVADLSKLLVEDFHEEVTDVAGGVLANGNDLYVAVGPDLWRLQDRNNDGIPDEKKSISHGYGIHIGFGGHGMSSVKMGPDGRIYWQIGDIGFNGKGPDGKAWEHPNSGVVVRSNPDGSDFEVFAYGVRNTHEFVFDEYGNLISEDNDGDHPGERERLVYIVNGSDTGWRSNWQYGKYRDANNNTYKVWMDEGMYKPRFEGQAAYFVPTLANFVSGPTGFLYNPGTALSPKYKNTFFVGEFVGSPARSGIHSFKLKPKGASFELSEPKRILGNVLATGIDWGPDGAMYVADWINGWDTKDYGRVWKLDDASAANSAERQLTRRLLAADFTKESEGVLADHLRNPDMRVRQKAQFELAKRGAKGAAVFEAALKQTDHQLARVHAIWGQSQLARQNRQYARALMPLLGDADDEIQAQAARWLGDLRYADAGATLVPMLKDANARVRFFAAEALGRIAYEPAVQPIIDMLQANDDQDVYLRHAGTLALARIGKAEPVVALAKSPSKALRIAAVVALRRMNHPGIADFLADADEYVVTEAARGINDDLSIKAALPALGNLLASTNFKNEALIRRAVNANVRVGTPEAMQHLIRYASNESAPVAMRAEALDALSTFAEPSVMDRVDGRYRGAVKRDPVALKAKAADTYIKLLTHSELPLRMSAVKAIRKLELRQASPELFARLKSDTDPGLRAEAVRTLVALNDPQIGKAIEQALSDPEKSVRVAALDLVGKSAMPKDRMVTLLSEVINTRTAEEGQAALLTLGKLPVQYSQKALDGLLTKLSNGTLPVELGLELEEAVESSKSPQLKAKYKSITGKLSADAVMASYKGALFGGDVASGRRIFFRHQTAQCIRCHSYDDLGGNAGPRLNGVAGRLSREQLLEAVINPSARIAPGFGEQGQPSSMPDMKYLLSKREIRDVVSFLATLKEEKQ